MPNEEMPTRRIEQEETFQEKVVRLSRALEESKDPEFIKGMLPELFALLENELHLPLLKGAEVDTVYSLFRTEECLIRVENFTRIMEAIGLGQSFKVGESADESHYANAVIPNPEGVRLAFAEGQASGPLRLAIGIGKSLVGFRADSDHIKVSNVDFSEDDARDIAKRGYLCRHVEGEILKEDIRGVVMRIPRVVMNDLLLTDDELEGEGQFVFRGFVV
jgi:hypothetical protein